MTTERRYTPEEVAALLDATSAGSAEWEALDRVYPMEVVAAQWEQVRQMAEALRAKQEADELAYDESVTLRLSDLRHAGTFWCYGYVYPVKEGDAAQGWGIWLATMGTREWDTNTAEQEDDWNTFEPAADEQAARAEATRRNRGEG